MGFVARVVVFLSLVLSVSPRVLAQVRIVHSSCPVEVVKTMPRVFSFRLYTQGEDGWRPAMKMFVDAVVKNTSDRIIKTLSFAVYVQNGPNGFFNQYRNPKTNVLLNLAPQQEKPVYSVSGASGDSGLDLVDVYDTEQTKVRVGITKIVYDDGEIVDSNCVMQSVQVPPPFNKPQVPHQHDDEKVYSASEITNFPRILFSPPLPEHIREGRPTTTVTLEAVIGSDGFPRDIKVLNSTLEENFTQNLVHYLNRTDFVPAMLDDKPVAVKEVFPYAY